VRFLRRLGFPDALIEGVEFLVRYHMMPPALEVAAFIRTDKILASPFFPVLLELYRADASSSYAGRGGLLRSVQDLQGVAARPGKPIYCRKEAAPEGPGTALIACLGHPASTGRPALAART